VLHAAGFPAAVVPEGISDLFGALFDGFSDLSFTTEPRPAEGDLVVETWTASGTHDGAFQGVAATGRAVRWSGIDIYRVACGHIAEVWTEADTLGLLRQIGAISNPGTPVAGGPAVSLEVR
jgi:predicted ester cyclase